MSTMYTASIGLVNSYREITLDGGGMVSALPSKLLVVRANAQTLSVQGMYDLQQQAFWTTAATLSGTLLDEFGNVITTVALLYASGSNGNFNGTFGDSTFSPALGRGYTIVFQGTSDWGHDFNLPVPAEVVLAILLPSTGTAPSLPVP